MVHDQHVSYPTRIVMAPLAIALFSGCTLVGRTGDLHTDFDVDASVLIFEGASDLPEAPVALYAYTNMTGAPDDINSYGDGGTPFVETTTSPDASFFPSTATSTPYYAWSFSTTAPVGSWTQGGLLRVRARAETSFATNYDLLMFDNESAGCINREISRHLSWEFIAVDCASATDPRVATLVSTVPAPAAYNPRSKHYLSFPGAVPDMGVPPDPNAVPTSPKSKQPATDNYYRVTNAEQTLTLFQRNSRYGFGTPAEVQTVYYNYGDLGLGRDMHCASFATGLACYVSNYGRDPNNSDPTTNVLFGQDPDTSINQAISNQGIIATVAMVYDTTNVANAVRFAVYAADGSLSPFAALDNPGIHALNNQNDATNANIAVPDNCLTCHGGSAAYVAGESVQKAKFLPFDPSNLRFSTTPGSSYSAANVLPQLAILNKLVLQTQPGPNGITDFITNTYPQVGTTAGENLSYVPPGWMSGGAKATEVYNEVVKPYCRMCHLSQDEGSGGLSWLTWNQFDQTGIATTIGLSTCGPTPGPMPQAERTQTLFWQSPARAHLVNALAVGGPCAPF